MKYLLIFSLLLSSSLCYSQVYRFRATQVCISKEKSDEKARWVKSTALIVEDIDKDIIALYTPNKITYAIIQTDTARVEPDETYIDARFTSQAVDKNGANWTLQVDLFKPNTMGYDAIFYFRSEGSLISYIANLITE